MDKKTITTFQLKEEHLKLLRRAYTTWDHAEYGAPGIDPKRPYGNSDVVEDICRILGWEMPDEDDEEQSRQVCSRARRVHEETETALQILLCFAGEDVRPGKYRLEGWGKDWERVEGL